MTGKGLLASFTIAAFVLINQCSAQNQKVTLFGKQDGAGPFVTLTETYSQDLGQQGFDNRAYSASVTGVFLFYDDYNYNPRDATMEYIFGPNNYRTNFQNLGGRVSSVRFAGHKKDYRVNTLTLYNGPFFQGRDEYTTGDLPNLGLDRAAKSLIVTGTAAWTLYALPKYQGECRCVYPPRSDNYTPAFIDDTRNVKVAQDSIRSVRIGCYCNNRKDMVEATSFKVGLNKIQGSNNL